MTNEQQRISREISNLTADIAHLKANIQRLKDQKKDKKKLVRYFKEMMG